MFKLGKVVLTSLLGVTIASAMIAHAAHAEQAIWRASKTTGEVWIAHPGVQPIALSSSGSVAPGDIVLTGRNGRVLLSRGEETILVSASSQIEIARDTEAGFSTILQKAGSILLEVERRNVQHFEVQTPYLVAVVKGTKFRVTVDDDASNVEVLRGQVEVRDYRSGQVALVNPSQAARVLVRGPSGLSVTGSGALGPFQQGAPGAASPQPSGSPGMPERRAEAAGETFRPMDGAGPASHDKVVVGPGDAIAGRTRPVSAPGTSNRENAGETGGEASRGSGNGALRGAFGGASDGANDGASDVSFSSVVKWVIASFTGGHGKNRDEEATAIMAIPAVVGVAVTLGVGMVRRRKRIKADEDRC